MLVARAPFSRIRSAVEITIRCRGPGTIMQYAILQIATPGAHLSAWATPFASPPSMSSTQAEPDLEALGEDLHAWVADLFRDR